MSRIARFNHCLAPSYPAAAYGKALAQRGKVPGIFRSITRVAALQAIGAIS